MKKNVASQVIGCQMVTAADGSAFTGSVTVAVTGDAGTQATGSVGAGACTHEGNGYHTYAPAQAETNYDLVAFTFTGTGAVPVTVQVYTLPATGVLAPTTAGRTLDVSAGGEAGVDWANVGGATTAVSLTNTTVATVTTTTTASAVTVVNGLAANVITASTIANDAITDAKVAADVTISAVTGAVGSVTGNVGGNVTGSVGSVVGAVGSVTGNVGGNVTGTIGGLTAAALKDFFDTDTTTTYGSAVAGSVVKEIADNAGGSALSETGIAETVAEYLFSFDTGLTYAGADANSVVKQIADNAGGSALTEAGIADAVLDELLAGHTTAGSLGKAVADTLEDTATTIPALFPANFSTLTIANNATAANVTRFGGTAGAFTAGIPDVRLVGGVTHGGTSTNFQLDAMSVGTSITSGQFKVATALWAAVEFAAFQVLTNTVAWNAAWDAEVQSEVADALAVYDPPTNAEMEARTLAAASYATAANQTTLASAIADLPTNAELATALAAADDAVLAAIAALNNVSDSSVAAAVLTTAMTEAYRSAGATATLAQFCYEVIAHLGEFANAGTTKTLKKLDGTTTAKTYTYDDADAPTSITEAS